MSKIFTDNIIAILWDFDCTLIPGYMQKPLFEHYQVGEKKFWHQVEEQAARYRQSGIQALNEMVYLNQILDFVRNGRFAGLNNRLLQQLAKKIQFYEGLPDFLAELKTVCCADNEDVEVSVEHYVLSSGLRQMIQGSAIAQHLNGVWACEFVEGDAPPHAFEKVAYVIDHTTKTRAVFEINKGANIYSEIDVNATMPEAERRVPISQMIYVGDGPSDVPVFSVINRHKGHTLAVYNPRSRQAHDQAYQLQEEKRVHYHAEAVYHSSSAAGRWLLHTVKEVAENIRKRHHTEVREQVGKPLKHPHDS